MQAYQRGDASAFEELYRRYSPKVYGYLRRRMGEAGQAGTVDDVFQAVFLKLHQSRGQYDPSLPFAPWLFTVCRTVMLDRLRKSQRSQESLQAEEDLAATALAEPVSESAGAGGGAEAALPELGSLKPQQREALELRYLKEQSFEEIARRLGTSPANVRQLVSRAIRKLKGGTS